MEIRHLRYFIAVAEELHFGRAAERLHVCQPPLSTQIRQLEEELGARLFDRTTKRVALTPAGHAFLEEARRVLRTIENAKERIQDISSGVEGSIHLGIVPSAMDTAVPEAVGSFHAKFSKVKLTIAEMGTLEQLKALRSANLDAAIVRLFDQDTAGLIVEKIFDEVYVLALPSGHRLETRKRISLKDLDGERMVFFPRSTHPQLHDRIMAEFTAAESTPLITQETSTKRTAVAMTAAGLGFALVPKSTKNQRRPGIVFRSVTGSLPRVEFSLVRRDCAGTSALNNLIAVIRHHCGGN